MSFPFIAVNNCNYFNLADSTVCRQSNPDTYGQLTSGSNRKTLPIMTSQKKEISADKLVEGGSIILGHKEKLLHCSFSTFLYIKFKLHVAFTSSSWLLL